jgi:DNA-binding response OmpR family regulator
MQHINVLSVEDDANLSTVLKHYLEEENATLYQVATGQECLNMLREKSDIFDIVLMDLGLPDIDGRTLIPQIKAIYKGPIIVLSGKTSTTDRVVGLEMGADDYVTKPFEMRELMARMKVQLRKTATIAQASQAVQDYEQGQDSENNKEYTFDKFIYDTSKMMLRDNDGKMYDLTSGECEMLDLFLKSKGRVLSREYLFQQTRGDDYDAFDRSIDIQVTRMRKKLNDEPSNPKIIKTVRGTGYMFISDVTVREKAA